MSQHLHGRHENGQNFLTDRTVVGAVVNLVAATAGPIVEIGPGTGALTLPLQRLQRPLTVVEIDPRLARALSRRLPTAHVVTGDFLRYRLPATPHVLVGNLPFSCTTAMLRHILPAPGWTDAVLIVQWEVARRRAGVGGATLMTAQWAPWFTFGLRARVPAASFRPCPSVDGGLLVVRRRPEPLLPAAERTAFHGFAQRVFTGPGRGLGEILTRTGAFGSTREAGTWLRARGVSPGALPRALSAAQWADLFRVSGTSPPRRPTPRPLRPR